MLDDDKMRTMIPDLFTRPSDGKTDDWYAAIRDKAHLTYLKEHILQIWRVYCSAGLNDPHFVEEFPVRFSHRWWELEVAWFLSRRGFDLKRVSPGPDLLCSKGDIRVYVEAVVPEPGDPNSPNSPAKVVLDAPDCAGSIIKSTSFNLSEREPLELLRLTNSIESKVDQYHEFLRKGRIDRQVPYVLAMSPVLIPHMVSDSLDIPAIAKAVYGIGLHVLQIDVVSGKVVRRGMEDRPEIQKSNQRSVCTAVFRPSPDQERYSGISGVLYSPCSFRSCSCSGGENHSFFLVRNNLISRNPLEIGCFGKNMDFWLEKGDDGYYLRSNTESA